MAFKTKQTKQTIKIEKTQNQTVHGFLHQLLWNIKLRAASFFCFSKVKIVLVLRYQEIPEAPGLKQRLTMPVILSIKANNISLGTGRQLEMGKQTTTIAILIYLVSCSN